MKKLLSPNELLTYLPTYLLLDWNMAGFVQNMTEFVLNRTEFVLNMTGFVLNMT